MSCNVTTGTKGHIQYHLLLCRIISGSTFFCPVRLESKMTLIWLIVSTVHLYFYTFKNKVIPINYISFFFYPFCLHFCLLIFSYLWLHHLIYKYVSVLCYAKWKNLPEMQMDPLSSNPLAVPFKKSKGRKWTSYTGNCWSLCMKALKDHWKHYQQIELPREQRDQH